MSLLNALKESATQGRPTMRWVLVVGNGARASHYQYRDEHERIVAMVIDGDEIYLPLYEAESRLGQYASLDGAKWAVERWHEHIVDLREKIIAGGGDATLLGLCHDIMTICAGAVLKRNVRLTRTASQGDDDEDGI